MRDLDSSATSACRDDGQQRAGFDRLAFLHEHLGQLIAYARANRVVPPWSK